MKKITTISILCVLLIITAVCTYTKGNEPNDGNSAISMGYGWSINENEANAVSEAVNMMLKQIDKPVFVMALTTAEYDTNVICQKLAENIKGAKLFGMNVYKYVIAPDGYHGGPKGAVGVLGLQADDVVIGIAAGATVDPNKIGEETKRIALMAIKDAGKTIEDKPLQVMVGSADNPEEKAIEALTNFFGKDIPINGGSAADAEINKGIKYVYDNNGVFSKGIAIAVIYSKGKLKTGNAFMSGFASSQKSGKATRIREFTGEHLRVIEEIDGRPAGEVYNEWLGGAITDRMNNGGSIFDEGHYHPLAIEKIFKGKKQYITLCPGKVDPQTKGLCVFAQPVEGETIYYMSGSVNALIKRMNPMIKNAMVDGRIKTSEMAGAYIIYCRGAYKTLTDRYTELYPEIKDAMGNKPFIAGFTSGEIGHISGHGNFHGNLMTTTVVFGGEKAE
jgi:hypothetical protein